MALESMQLWQATLAHQDDQFETPRDRLRVSLNSMRERVEQLVSTLGSELPDLTVHDITHIDALWRVASVIAGADYPVNPAEAYVLGGAFLLHDSAHVLAAYPGGVSEIKATSHWRDLIAQRFASKDPTLGSAEEKSALFQVLRHLHAEQAHRLTRASWAVPGNASHHMRLIEDEDLDRYYGDLIGEIASSHHWSANRVAEHFADRVVSPPAFLNPASWTVDAMKVAFLLRTADAAHLDSLRAPWFLFALRRPMGISEEHWRFQAKLGQPTLNHAGELVIACGAPFDADERRAWWLAFDAAKVVDKELRDAFSLLRDGGRQTFAARNVFAVISPEAFARQVRVHGWEPVNVEPIISNIPKIIAGLGGEGLYGNNLEVPIRELIQNATDAIRAARKLGQIETDDGEIHVSIEREDIHDWRIHISDSGIGMSRHVLTNVLLDFGNSLWSSDLLREELPGLAALGYESTGKFGIGFYSAFMLGAEVSVVTRRYERGAGDNADQWRLSFEDGLDGRPVLSHPTGMDRLKKSGTRVSIRLNTETIQRLLSVKDISGVTPAAASESLVSLVGKLAPASDIRVITSFEKEPSRVAIEAQDWLTLGDEKLLERVSARGSLLITLKDGAGKTIGRVAPAQAAWRDSATLFFNGISCGQISGLVGILEAQTNNVDAKRTISMPAGSIECWTEWARHAVEHLQNPTIPQLALLHPLLPAHDLRVWQLSGEPMNLQTIGSKIQELEEVYFHDGEITPEDYDEMGGDYFDELAFDEPVVSSPSRPFSISNRSMTFPGFLGVSQIDYEEKLEELLRQHWPDFERLDGEHVYIGSIRGAAISRYVTRYRRSSDASA